MFFTKNLYKLLLIGTVLVGGSMSSNASMPTVSEEIVLRSDILSRRSDPIIKSFFESCQPATSKISENLPDDVSKELSSLCKILNVREIDWLNYFTSANSTSDIYHHEEDSEIWIENEMKIKTDFSKYVGLLLYIRENSDKDTNAIITDYLTQLCKIFTDIEDPTLLRNFSPFIPYANFASDVLKGKQSIIPINAREKNESVIYSVPAIILDGQNGKDTLWNPKVSDMNADETDYKFLILTRLLITVYKLGSAENKEKSRSVLISSKLATERLVSNVFTPKYNLENGRFIFDMNQTITPTPQIDKIMNFFNLRALVLNYCLEKIK